MIKSTRKVIKNSLIIVTLIILLVGAYLVLLFLLRNSAEIIKGNEFGDYVGGVLNPLFTLLSTVAIIYLTFIIAKNEDKKAEKSIETQKRITLNQMRQESLNRLSDKLNMFVYEFDKINMASANDAKITKSIIGNNIKKEKSFIWLVILIELDNFLQNEYLFTNLFKEETFKNTYSSLDAILSKLSQEQNEQILIEEQSLGKYIDLKQKIITLIGNYIYSEF